jgi:hypothetical protein
MKNRKRNSASFNLLQILIHTNLGGFDYSALTHTSYYTHGVTPLILRQRRVELCFILGNKVRLCIHLVNMK